jgi:hypothetical protein
MTPTATQTHQAAIEVLKVVASTIKELGSVPSGVLYAHLAGYFDLNTYTSIIDTLVSAGVIKKEANHMLTWIEK